MKKIDVITLHNVNNYGSVLQSYATQEILKKKGYTVEFINYYRKNLIPENLLKNQLESSKFFSKNFLTKFIGKIVLPHTINKQIKVFSTFVENNLNVTKKKYYSYEELKKEYPKADIYCTGSDQMWNAEWNKGIEKAYYLDFLPDSAKRFSLSSSFGRDNIDSDEKKQIEGMLKKYSAISVRENSGVKILKEMKIDNGEHVLDPTLLLRKEDWENLLKFHKVLPPNEKKYILVYQLNMKNKEFDDYVKKISKIKKMPVIRVAINDYQKFKYGKMIATPEVLTFLNYFVNAEYVVTDSFHGTAFSINLNKKFICVFPKKFSTRLQSILDLTDLNERKLKEKQNNYDQIDEKIDFEKVNRILEKEREKTHSFIEKALKLCLNE